MSLINIVNNKKTDKNTVHSYLETYEKIFEHKKNTAKNILEIGVQDGGSIKLWNDYFVNATIYGLDIRKIRDHWPTILSEPRVRLGCFDAYDSQFFYNQMINLKFDIMIDDGPHTLESMIFFIENYSKLLEDDGILVVEDVQSIDWIKYLTTAVPENLQKYISVYDLRENKNRYDDILFVIDKSK
jgi:cephalosporin hydroxylase